MVAWYSIFGHELYSPKLKALNVHDCHIAAQKFYGHGPTELKPLASGSTAESCFSLIINPLKNGSGILFSDDL
jgi:hypothetical protein